jgi:putative ABC transport system permease protein
MPAYPFAWRYTAREVRRRPVRSLLTLVGIALGVTAVAAVTLSTQATHEAYAGMFRSAAGRAALELRCADGESPFAAPLDQAAAIPGVQAAVGVVQAPAGLLGRDGPVPLLVLGVDPERDDQVRDYRLRQGTALTPQRGLLLEAGFAARHGCALGRPAHLLTPRGPVEVVVTGLLEAHGPARFNGGAIAFLPLRQAQFLFGMPGQVHAVQVVPEPAARVDDVRRALAERFPKLTVGVPAERGSLAGEALASIDRGLSSLTAIVIVAAGLVILNTFLMNLNERQRQLALLRALGATRRQVLALLLGQALLLGVVGTLLGLPVGVLLAALLLRWHEHFLGIPMPALAVSAQGLLLAAVLGPAMTLLAVLAPARRAAGRSPLAGLRVRGGLTLDAPPRWLVVLGLLLLGLVALFEVAIVRHWLAADVGNALLPLALAVCLVGCACVLPALLPPLVAVAGAVVRPVLGLEAGLAIRQLMRQRARTALTVSVVFAALTTSLSFGLSLLNNTRDLRLWYRHTVDGDFLLRAVWPDPAVVVTPAPLPAGTRDAVLRLPGCRAVDRVRFHPSRVDGVPLLVLARDFAPELPLIVMDGDPADVVRRLRQGEAVLGTALAFRLGVSVGDEVALPTPHGRRSVRVCGLVKEYGVGGLVLYMDWDRASEWFGFTTAHALAVHARPGEQEVLQGWLREYSREHDLLLQRNDEFASTIHRMVNGALWLVGGLVGLICIVTAAGVVNTLTTNVLDQTRELGVLRAVGMKRRGVQKLVLAQAAILALVSCATGGPAGVALAYLMNLALPGLLGHHIPFGIDWGFALACLAGVVVLTAVAALLPARRAAHMVVIDAIRYE